jgi:alkylation response protein AidB-like acyl-CoA dehydrogenase
VKPAVISRADGGWRLSGTKTRSSRAAFADRAFGLFRTGRATEARSLSAVTGREVIAGDASTPVADAFELGTLACAAQLLGAGRALLAASVRHAGTRAPRRAPADEPHR